MSNPFADVLQNAAAAYGTDPGLLTGIARRESGFRPQVMNNWDSNAKKGIPSGGLMQFIEPTYTAFSRQARAANPRAWQGVNDSWMDPQAQALAASWAIANGKGGHWATFRAAQADRGKGAGVQGGSVPVGGTTFDTTPGGGFDEVLFNAIAPRNPIVAMLLAEEDAPAPAMAAPRRARRGGGGGGAFVGADTGKFAGKDYRWLQQQGQKLFGLENDPGNSQTVGGRHSTGSEHYDARAVDFGNARNSPQQLSAWQKWARRQGLDVLNEGDHIHVSLPGSGI